MIQSSLLKMPQIMSATATTTTTTNSHHHLHHSHLSSSSGEDLAGIHTNNTKSNLGRHHVTYPDSDEEDEEGPRFTVSRTPRDHFSDKVRKVFLILIPNSVSENYSDKKPPIKLQLLCCSVILVYW